MADAKFFKITRIEFKDLRPGDRIIKSDKPTQVNTIISHPVMACDATNYEDLVEISNVEELRDFVTRKRGTITMSSN